MLCLIFDLSVRDVLGVLLGFFGLVAIVATVIGYFLRGFKKEGDSHKDELIDELKDLCTVHKEKIAEVSRGLESCKSEHEKCEMRINDITAFNLRLQARELGYQQSINRLEQRLGLPTTDFINVSHAPENPFP